MDGTIPMSLPLSLVELRFGMVSKRLCTCMFAATFIAGAKSPCPVRLICPCSSKIKPNAYLELRLSVERTPQNNDNTSESKDISNCAYPLFVSTVGKGASSVLAGANKAITSGTSGAAGFPTFSILHNAIMHFKMVVLPLPFAPASTVVGLSPMVLNWMQSSRRGPQLTTRRD